MVLSSLLLYSFTQMPSNGCLIAIDADDNDNDKKVVSNTNAVSQPKFYCNWNS